MMLRLVGIVLAGSAFIAFQSTVLALSTMECRSELMKWKRQKPHKVLR